MFGTYKFGIISEYIAVIYLFFKGYKILHRRYKTKLGEIDIIAVKKNALVAVEVKARKKKTEIGDSVQNKQFRRINNAMRVFLYNNPKYANFNIRIDVILISPKHFPKRVENAWMEKRYYY
jgi:putative endonuclease